MDEKKLKITLRKWNQEEHTKFVLQAKLSSNLHKKGEKKTKGSISHKWNLIQAPNMLKLWEVLGHN